MKTIALISHSAGLQGAEKMLLNLAILLKNGNRFSPLLFIPDSPGPLYDEARKHGIRYFSYQSPPWHISQINLTSFSVAFRASFTSLKNALIENPCELILVNTHVSIVPVNVAVALDTPLIIWCHGIIDASMIEPTPGFSHVCNQWLLSAASKFVVVSKWTGEYYRSFFGVKDYSLLPNWLPSEAALSPLKGKYRSGKFVCLGSHEEIKGIDVLINAANELKRRGCKFEIDIFGDGPLHKEHQDKVNAHFLKNRIHFHGFVSDNINFYENKLCMISPSYVDSFGLTLVEGMANKTPVIATRAGGSEEIIEDGFTGFLIDRGDYLALADKMEFFLKNPTKAKEMGENGYRVFQERFSERAAKDAFNLILHDTISNYRGYDPSIKLAAEMFQYFITSIPQEHVLPAKPEKSIEVFDPSSKIPGYQSALRLESGLVYTIIPQKNVLICLDILVKADTLYKPLGIKMYLRLPNGQIIRKSKAIISEFGHEIWLNFGFIPLANIKDTKLLLELVPEHPRRNVIRIYEKNDFEGKLIRAYRRIMGLLGFSTRGNQLCIMEL